MKAYGTFTKIGDYIYRTDTYLQFGDSEELLGACVLCNPGSAELANNEKMQYLIELNNPKRHEEKGELKVDPAMRQIIEILEGIYGPNLKGRFRIFNLFTLRNADMKAAIDCIKNSYVDPIMLFKDYQDFSNSRLDVPWILTAWGVDELKILRDIKHRWLELINQKDVKQIGKLKKEPLYYHPTPHSHIKKKAFVKSIISLF